MSYALGPPNGFTAHKNSSHEWWLAHGREQALFAAVEKVKIGQSERLTGGRGAIYRVPFDEQSRVLVRRYRRGGFVRHFIHDLYWDRPLRPFAELRSTLIAKERGVSTVEAVGAGVAWSALGCYRGMLITREADGFHNCWDWLQASPSDKERQLVGENVRQMINTMHDAGIYHADLNLTNILVRFDSGQPEARIIDFDRARILPTPLSFSQRKKNFARLQRSMTKLDPGGRIIPPQTRRNLTNFT